MVSGIVDLGGYWIFIYMCFFVFVYYDWEIDLEVIVNFRIG